MPTFSLADFVRALLDWLLLHPLGLGLVALVAVLVAARLVSITIDRAQDRADDRADDRAALLRRLCEPPREPARMDRPAAKGGDWRRGH